MQRHAIHTPHSPQSPPELVVVIFDLDAAAELCSSESIEMYQTITEYDSQSVSVSVWFDHNHSLGK